MRQAVAHKDRAFHQNKTAFSCECADHLETAVCGSTREETQFLPGSRGLCSRQLHPPRELLPYVSSTGRLSCAPARLPHLPSSDSGIDNMFLLHIDFTVKELIVMYRDFTNSAERPTFAFYHSIKLL